MSTPTLTFSLPRLAVLFTLLACVPLARAQTPPLGLAVDASQVGRSLLTTTLTFDAPSENFVLLYPKWIQGTHAPSGPIENIGGLKFFGNDDAVVEWERDPLDVYRFLVKVPKGTKTLRAELVYLINQPSVNSEGIDSQGNSWLGIINWNTCLLYPEGANIHQLNVRASMKPPADWKLASALDQEATADGTVQFKEASLATVVDSPVIIGKHLRSIPLKSDGLPQTYLDLTSESEAAIQIPQSLIDTYGQVGTEAALMFGGAPFDTYRYLVTCSNDIGANGLEHSRSSFNGVGERALLEEKELRGWVGYLLPHEFVHAWCGKYRRPEGMVKTDFHSAMDTSLLWTYEGLTQYLGLVLCARSGMWSMDHYKQMLAGDLTWMVGRTGRNWRDLEDTARASYTLRAHSPNWGNLRRGQDYYDEGALWWMEADAIIRLETDGKKSLDDFCTAFFGPGNGPGPVIPFSREDLMKTLHGVVDYDWEGFFDSRVNQTHEYLPAEFAARLGYRMQSASQPSAAQKEEEESGGINEMYSIGASFSGDGTIRSNIVPGLAAEKAGLAANMKVVAVNSRTFSKDRLRDAIADSTAKRAIEFLVLDGDTYRTYTLDYADGPKYLELARDTDRPDVLEQILKAKRKVEGK